MKSANSGTPGSYLEVKGLHRLGDAVVGRRRDAVAADALEEAHRLRVTCPWFACRWEATGARRKVTPGAACEGCPWTVVEKEAALRRRLFQHDAC